MNVPPGHWFEEMRAADDDIGDAGSQLMVSLLVVRSGIALTPLKKVFAFVGT
jgi:hypothetical protein